MRSKLLTLLVLLPMLLVACGDKSTPAPTATATRQKPTVTPTEVAPEPTATAEPKPTPTEEPEAQPAGTFEKGPCPFGVPAGQAIECGRLEVRVEHAQGIVALVVDEDEDDVGPFRRGRGCRGQRACRQPRCRTSPNEVSSGQPLAHDACSFRDRSGFSG